MSSSFFVLVFIAGIVSTLIVCIWDIVIYPKQQSLSVDKEGKVNFFSRYLGQIFVQDLFISFLILSIHFRSAIEAYKIALIIWVTFYCIPLLLKSFLGTKGSTILSWQNEGYSITLIGRLLSLLSISAIYSYFI